MLRVADLFCGAGGTSTGLLRACRKLGVPVDLVAINHWQTAIDTHELNHPQVRHKCASIDSLNPKDVVPSGKLVSPTLFQSGRMDIYKRMLTETELAMGQGFPSSYQFAGARKKDRIRQIGNAVPTYTAEALCHSAVESIIQ